VRESEKAAEACRRGLRFLTARQRESGDFETLWSRSGVLQDDDQRVRNVFVTSCVVQSLVCVRNDARVVAAVARALDWLESERDDTGFWTFNGRRDREPGFEGRVPPDIDDTATVVAALARWDRLTEELRFTASRLLEHRTQGGLFVTWIHDEALWRSFTRPDEVDPVVNANAYYLYRLLGWELREVRAYLESEIEGEQYGRTSRYYYTPVAFLYAFAKAWRLDGAPIGDGVRRRAAARVAAILMSGIGGGASVLELALGLSAASMGRMSCGSEAITSALLELLGAQGDDGGWPACVYGGDRRTHYGSREHTTASVVEALTLARAPC
jgi:hypothetical protein